MKREIKFRAKDTGGEWHYGDLELPRNKERNPYIHSYKENGEYDKQYPIDDDTIGQFTGLYDKNGREIYEGDILSIGEYRYVCEFVEGGFEFRDKRDNLLIVKSIVHHTEVIGNIHDNKEKV